MKLRFRNWLVPFYLALCLMLGGASAAGFGSNLALQWAGLPIIVWALVHQRQQPGAPGQRTLMLLVAGLVALFAIQLVPLPPGLWTVLPGRGPVAEGYAMLGVAPGWQPLSLDWRATVASFLWLLPAFAILLAVLRLGAFDAKLTAWVVIAVTAVSVFLGALQVVGGRGWYFYTITNLGNAVGFFSNSNHAATLLVATIPFLAALYASRGGGGRRHSRRSLALLVMLGSALAVIGLGILLNFSLAGIGLAVPALAASAALIRLRGGRSAPVWAAPMIGVVTIAAVAGIMMGPFGNNLTGGDATRTTESRAVSFARTFEAATDALPFGTGIGTFQPAYRAYENPADVNRVYMNHAHSDVLEILLETGVPGALLAILFGVWWVIRTLAIWRSADASPFARAATIVVGVITAHSAVDYPLRTAAIAALFAVACGLMLDPRPFERAVRSKASARHLSAD